MIHQPRNAPVPKPAVGKTELTLLDFTMDTVARLKKAVPQLLIRPFFDRKFGLDVTQTILEHLRDHISHNRFIKSTLQNVREKLMQLTTSDATFIVIYPGNAFYNDLHWAQTVSELSQDPKTKEPYIKHSVQHGYKLTKEDKNQLRRLLEENWPGVGKPLFEELLNRTIPEYIRLPEGSFTPVEFEARSKIVELIERAGPDAEKGGPDLPLREEIFNVIFEIWSRFAFSDKSEAYSRIDDICETTNIKDREKISFDEMMQKVIAPIAKNRGEVMRRMVLLEERAMNAVLEVDQESVNHIWNVLHDLREQHDIYDCDLPSLSVAFAAMVSRSTNRSLSEITEMIGM